MQQNYRYLNATGKLKFNMTNDYMFRMVLQNNKETLIGLISSVLEIPKETIIDCRIENVVEPGKTINAKEYQLDILVSLNGNILINIEMQVINYNNWLMRSLSYTCRRFDNVSRGNDYNTVKPVYHISFLDFTLFEDHPEFFAKYQLRNSKDNFLYTDKFNLYVVELNHIDMATAEDMSNHIDTWARLFKATTWEEIKMITKDNPSLNSTAESIFLSNKDYVILEQCRAREDAIAHEKYQKEQISKLSAENASLIAEKALLSKKVDDITEEYMRLKKLLEEKGITP